MEAGLEQARWGPGEQDRRAERQEVPAVARPRQEPGQRGEPACDTGPNHGRLPADREHVGGDRRDGDDLGGEPWDPQQPGEPEHAEREERDVLPRDGQEVIEPGRLEAVPELVREPLVLAEHDAREHRAPLPFEPRGDRARDMRTKSIGDAADAPAAADDPPVATVEHDVNAAARQPAALVEPVFRPARRVHPRTEGEDGALRRRAADGQLEQNTLPQRAVTEPPHLGGHPQRELCLSHRTGHDRRDRGRAAELRLEQAAVERSEPRRAEPPAGERERQRAGRQPRARVTAPRRRGEDDDQAEHERRSARGVRKRQPEARGEHEQGGPAALDHGDTSSRSCSTRAGPMPGIASRSSTERKPPCVAR